MKSWICPKCKMMVGEDEPRKANGQLVYHVPCFPESVYGPPPTGLESSLQEQVGGSHYKDMAIQPIEFIHKNGIGFIEGCVIKYLVRWRSNGGIEDVKKARHFLDMLIEMESK